MKRLYAVILVIAILVGGYILLARYTDLPSLKELYASVVTPRERDVPVAPSASPRPEITAEDISKMTEALTISRNDLNGLDKFNSIDRIFLNYSMPGQAGARNAAAGFNDAVSFPFVATEAKGMFAELEYELLKNPVLLDMGMRGLIDLEYATGRTIGMINPWMQEFITQTDEAMAVKTGWAIWLEKDNVGTVYVTREYREYAEMFCLLLEHLAGDKIYVESFPSVKNWHLPPQGDAFTVRTELATYQEDREALVLEYVVKDGTTVIRIGFNIHDKRLEILRPEEEPPTPPPTTPPEPTPPPTDPPSPPPTDPPSPPPTTPPKDPAQDPVNQGHADTGGGQNQPTDGTGTFQPTEPPRPAEEPTNIVQPDPPAPAAPAQPETPPADFVDTPLPPPADPIPQHDDSHDTPDQSAGDDNGEFSMP